MYDTTVHMASIKDADKKLEFLLYARLKLKHKPVSPTLFLNASTTHIYLYCSVEMSSTAGIFLTFQVALVGSSDQSLTTTSEYASLQTSKVYANYNIIVQKK